MYAEARDFTADDPVVLARERPFRLGDVEVRPGTREVVGPGERVVVEPRVMQVLVALAHARGEIVDRDALIARCWGGRAVGEDAISRVISQLRRLSDGLGRDGWTLETITKVGYRLLPAGAAPPETAAEPLSAEPATAEAATPAAPSRRLLLGAAAGAATTAVVGAGGYVAWRARRRPPERAQVLFRKGVESLDAGSPEACAQAVAFLREAVSLAPDYADAWGALALAYNMSTSFTAPPRQPGVIAQAEAAARRSLELDADNPRGSAARALLTPTYGNWQAAEAQFERAMRLYPDAPYLPIAYIRVLNSVGRIRETVPLAQQAVKVDEFSPHYRYVLAHSLWGAGRVEEADIALEKARTRWPRQFALWFMQLFLWTYTGRIDRALAMGEDTANWPIGIPAPDVEISLIGVRALASGAPADIERAYEATMAAARRGAGYAENAMNWLCAIGRVDDAFTVARGLYFGEGFTVGDSRFSESQGRYMVRRKFNTHHLFMPPTAPMRRDLRWPKLMADLGIARYWRATGKQPDDPAWARAA
jgi:DNA-binding winged helix-turn-helix (wHTH) protein/tetratricopeptide (TPR) repeat protein